MDFANPEGTATKEDRLSRRGLLKTGGGLLMGSAAALGTAARADAASQSGQEIVGSWLVTVGTPRAPNALALLTFSGDGSVLQTIVPYDGENDATTGHGVWATIGPGEFGYTFVRIWIDEHGKPIGTVKIRGTMTVDAASDTYSGRSQVDRLDLDGNLVRRGSPTLEGRRITLEAML